MYLYENKHKNNPIILPKRLVIFTVFVFQVLNSVVLAQQTEIEKEIWQSENRYWNYLEMNDTVSYKRLWVYNQLNYQSGEKELSDQKKCSYWMRQLHEDNSLEFSFALHKKAIEIARNRVIIHYDVHKFWTDKQHNIYKSESFSFSHTWIKSENKWLLSEGIAIKNE